MLSFSTPNVICFNARIALKSQKCVPKKVVDPPHVLLNTEISKSYCNQMSQFLKVVHEIALLPKLSV